MDPQKLRELVLALLRSSSEGMPMSDIWRGLQNRGVEMSYREFEDWLLDQVDLIKLSGDGKVIIKPGVDFSQIRRTHVVPDPYEELTDVTAATRMHRYIKYCIDCLREEGKAIAAYREQQNASFALLDQELFSSGKNFASVRTSTAGDFIRNASGGTRSAFYGYPLLLEWVDTGDGEFADYKVIPVFIMRLDIQEEAEKCIFHSVTNAVRLNPLILDRLRWKDRSFVRSKLDADPSGYSSFEERLAMLTAVLQDMEVKEELDPKAIFRAADLSLIGPNNRGLYNRCGIFLGDSNNYIKGLIRDLEEMQEMSHGHFEKTALSPLMRSATKNEEEAKSSAEVIRVLSPGQGGEFLNAQQNEAVKQAFANQISVITGPPGTGKSQVVTAIITSAVLQDKTVLFASRNNKALEVVQDRLKKACPEPHTLIRVGGNYDQDCSDLIDRMGNLPAKEDVPFATQMASIDLHLGELDKLEKKIDETVSALGKGYVAEERFEILRKQFLPVQPGDYELIRAFPTDKLLTVVKRLDRLMQITASLPSFLGTMVIRLQGRTGSVEIALLQSELKKACINKNLTWPKDRKELQIIFQILLTLIDLVMAVADKEAAIASLGEADKLGAVYENIVEHRKAIAKKLPALLMAKIKERSSGRGLSDDRTQDALLQYRNSMPMLRGARLNDDQRRVRLLELGRVFPHILQRLPAWAVTNLSVSHRIPLEPALFDLVVIDEASQCDIPSCLPLLYRAKRAIIIGDPLQLPQITNISQTLEDQLLRQYQLDGPENDHLRYSEKSMYDAARRVTPNSGYQFLSSHYRCHPDIINFANSAHWYDSNLEVFTEVKKLNRPNFWKRGIEWNQVKSVNIADSPKGYCLRDEVDRVVDIVHDLLVSWNYEGTVGVVCPFRGMTDLIRDGVDKRVRSNLLQAANFDAQTAHGFQGDERDIIIYAMAVHPDMPRGSAWFIAENSNLFNVALSRARAAFVAVGDKDAIRNFTFEDRPVEYLRDFVVYVENLVKEQMAIRGEPSFTPAQLWEEKFYLNQLKPAQIPVVSQYVLGPYKLDFAVLREGKQRKLDIEIDGETFHKDNAGRRLRRDIDRNIYVKAQDGGTWDIMRFWVYELEEDMGLCLKKIQQWMNSAP